MLLAKNAKAFSVFDFYWNVITFKLGQSCSSDWSWIDSVDMAAGTPIVFWNGGMNIPLPCFLESLWIFSMQFNDKHDENFAGMGSCLPIGVNAPWISKRTWPRWNSFLHALHLDRAPRSWPVETRYCMADCDPLSVLRMDGWLIGWASQIRAKRSWHTFRVLFLMYVFFRHSVCEKRLGIGGRRCYELRQKVMQGSNNSFFLSVPPERNFNPHNSMLLTQGPF